MKKKLNWQTLVILSLVVWVMSILVGGVIASSLLLLLAISGTLSIFDIFRLTIKSAKEICFKNGAISLLYSAVIYVLCAIFFQIPSRYAKSGALMIFLISVCLFISSIIYFIRAGRVPMREWSNKLKGDVAKNER